ncbi:MAG: hypothetical protein ACP5QK_01825 [Myxococcota bacterium]
MKIKSAVLFLALLVYSCGGMDPKLKNTDFELQGPYITDRAIYYINPALNSIIKIDSEKRNIIKYNLKNKIYSIIDKLLPELYFTSVDQNSGLMNLIHFDESKSEEEIIKLGSPFTSFDISPDNKYLIMRHTANSSSIGGGKVTIFFKNEMGIYDIENRRLTKTTLNFSIMDRKIIFSEPGSHLLTILCKEGVILMDYTKPSIVKYIYLDINKKSPEIEYGVFSKNSKYLFFKAKDRDDIYSISITSNDDDLSIKVNVPSSPYKGLQYIAPITIDENEDTLVAQFNSPSPRLVIISAESDTAYKNQIVLDSGSHILDTFNFGNSIYALIVNYWLKYVRIVSLYPTAENQKEEIQIFANDYKVIGYTASRDILLLLYSDGGTSIKFIRPMITDKAIKMNTKEFSFNAIRQDMMGYSRNYNTFFFISGYYDERSSAYKYLFNYINLNNDFTDNSEIDYLPSRIIDINEQTFLLTDNETDDFITLINLTKIPKAVSFVGLKYDDILQF